MDKTVRLFYRVPVLGLWMWILAGAGCAWFGSGPELDVNAAWPEGEAPDSVSMGSQPRDSTRTDTPPTAAPGDTVSVVAIQDLVPEDSLRVAEGESVPRSVVKPSGGIPIDALAGSDDWHMAGEELNSETGPGGQVIRIKFPVITHQQLTITSEEGEYEVDREVVTFTNDVVFQDTEMRGVCQTAEYYRKTGVLYLSGGVEIETDTLQVRSDSGEYRRDDNVFFMFGSVDGRRDNRRMLGEEAEWLRDLNQIIFREDVLITNDDDQTRLAGEEIVYDLDDDRAYVSDRPSLVINPGENTSTKVEGNRLWLDPDGGARVAGSVRVVRGRVTANSDSAWFAPERDLAILLGNPVVHDGEGTMDGDILYLHFAPDETLDRLEIHGNTDLRFAPIDSMKQGEVSTVHGDSLTMFFNDEGADSVLVRGNAKSTYRPSPLDGSSGAGTNAVQGDTITIFLDEGAVNRVHVNGNAKGVFTFVSRESSDGAGDSLAAVPGKSTGDSLAAVVPGKSTGDSLALVPGSVIGDSLVAAPGDFLAGTAEESDSLTAGGTPAPSDLTIEGAVPGKEKVIYSAQEVHFFLEDRIVDLFREITLDYGQLTLTAGKVRFYADRRYLDAEDNPILVERQAGAGEREVVGEHMEYNLSTREGTIDTGRTKAEDGFIYADRLRKIEDDQFIARSGNFTTCDLADSGEDPHFHFTSDRMRIYMGDKVVAKPVTLYIRDIPVFGIPFYVFSIRKGRQSGLLTPDLDFGLGGSSGRFFRNLGYYWAASDYYDLKFSADYQDKPSRFVGRVEANYAKRYLMSGTVSFARTLGSTSQHDLVGAHRMTLGEWQVTGRAEFRDREFRQNEPLGPNFGARLDRRLISDLSLSRRFAFGANLSLTARREQDIAPELEDGLDETVLNQTLPRYSFSLFSRTLGRAPDAEGEGGRLPALASVRVSFSSSGSAQQTKREKTTITFPDSVTADSTFALISERNTNARHTFSISDTRKALGAFNLSPNFSLTETWTDREFSVADTVKGFRRAAVWNASVGINSTLYGTFGGLGPVQALRHTFRPSARLTYRPEFSSLSYQDTSGVARDRFPGIGSTESKQLSLSMEHGFQAKVSSGDDVRRIDLLRWSLSSGYDFVVAQRGERAWQDVHSVVDLSQILPVGLNFNSVHDPYNQFRFKSFGVSGNYSFGGTLPGGAPPPPVPDPTGEEDEDWSGRGADLAQRDRGYGAPAEGLGWTAGFTFSYSGTRNFEDVLKPTASINGRANLRLTKNWSVSYDARWDVSGREVLGENLSLHRDLHCWEAQFTRSSLGDDTSFYFRLNVKNMSDVKYEQGRRGGSGLPSLPGLLP